MHHVKVCRSHCIAWRNEIEVKTKIKKFKTVKAEER